MLESKTHPLANCKQKHLILTKKYSFKTRPLFDHTPLFKTKFVSWLFFFSKGVELISGPEKKTPQKNPNMIQ